MMVFLIFFQKIRLIFLRKNEPWPGFTYSDLASLWGKSLASLGFWSKSGDFGPGQAQLCVSTVHFVTLSVH